MDVDEDGVPITPAEQPKAPETQYEPLARQSSTTSVSCPAVCFEYVTVLVASVLEFALRLVSIPL